MDRNHRERGEEDGGREGGGEEERGGLLSHASSFSLKKQFFL